MTFTPAEMDMAREAADTLAGLVVSIGLPWIATWAVGRHLVEQRWAVMIVAAANAGLAAGHATGLPMDTPAFRKAAEGALLAYAKSQAPDVLTAKGMTDDRTIEAGMARMSGLTGGAIGPNGSVIPSYDGPAKGSTA